MLTIKEAVPAFETFHEMLEYEPQRSLFFDIETTGFSPASSVVFLIGMLSYETDGWQLTQLLAEHAHEECNLLAAFLEKASRYDTLVHFNGSTFDLPYLKKKALHYGFSRALEDCASVDLYQRFRPLAALLHTERMNQQSLEAFLGWPRTDRLTGKHMVSLFQKYDASGEPGLRALLLLHNHDDLLGMTQLTRLAAYLYLCEGAIGEILSAEASPAQLTLTFSLAKPLPAALSADGTAALRAQGDTAALSVSFVRETLRHFFPDYKNYFYLPLEDQAIHKSVAVYVDKANRRPAKAADCYIKKSGVFLPQPKEVFTPAFQKEYDSSELYFAYTDAFLQDKEQLAKYVEALLRALSGKPHHA